MNQKAGYKESLKLLGTVPGIVLWSIGAIVQTAAMVSVPFFLGHFINVLVYGGRVVPAFVWLAGMALLALILDLFLKRWIAEKSHDAEFRLREQMLDSFCSMSPAAIEGYRNGEVALKFFRDAEIAGGMIRDLYPQFLHAACGILFAFGLVFSRNWMIAFVFFSVIPVMFLAFLPYQAGFRRMNRSVRQTYDGSMNRIFEFMHVFPFLKSMAAETPYKKDPLEKFRRFRRVGIIRDLQQIRFDFLLRGLLFLGEYSVLAVAGYLAWKKEIPVGDIVVYQVLFMTVLNSFSGLFRMLPSLETIHEAGRSIHELLENDVLENDSGKRFLRDISGRIEVKNLLFRYPGSERVIFRDFSISIQAGERIALTGNNGSGKTTLLKLLTGYMDPAAGDIAFDGIPLKTIQKSSIRKQIAVVFQDSLLMTGSVRHNITLRNNNYSEEEIAHAALLSGADTLIRRVPEGLEKRIGFDGSGLSGGEMQKLAIARALVRNARILVLDEVTNHLDYESRSRIRTLLKECRGRQTVILVSHDPEITALCDREIHLDCSPTQ